MQIPPKITTKKQHYSNSASCQDYVALAKELNKLTEFILN